MKRIVRIEVFVEVCARAGEEHCDVKCPHLRRGEYVDASCTLFETPLKNRTYPMGRRDVIHTWERDERCLKGEVKA